MSNKQLYEVLEGLPPYGPMYIPIGAGYENPFSEGMVIRFLKSDSSKWVGNFATGWSTFSFVSHFGQNGVVVIAKGQGYIMSPDLEEPIATFGVDINWAEVWSNAYIAFATGTGVGAIGEDGQIWLSKRISWDGIKDVILEGNIVSGLSYDATQPGDVWIPFEINLETKKLIGGSYSRA